MSLSGINPASLIIFLAKSMILTGYPYQKYRFPPIAPLRPIGRPREWSWNNGCNRDWPLERCLVNKGTTEPLEPKTLPKRVVMNFVAFTLFSFRSFNCRDWTYFSFTRSHHVTWVDCLIRGNHDKLHHIMFASQIGQVLVPSILVRTCDGFSSINGTCYAAAWNTTSGLYSLNTLLNASLFLISATTLHILALETILSASKLGGAKAFRPDLT
jgi:hypothetical protein